MRILTDTAVSLSYRPKRFTDALLRRMPIAQPRGADYSRLPPSHTSCLEAFSSRLPSIHRWRADATHSIGVSSSRTRLSPIVVRKHGRIDVVWELFEAAIAIPI